MRHRFRLLAAACLLCAAPAVAQTGAPPWEVSPAFQRAMDPMVPRATASAKVVTTRHAITLAGKRIGYRAIVTETPLAGADGTPAAVAVTYAYVADGVRDTAKRPVLFIFNGGPGASSSPLHMKGIGPRRLVGTHMEDNPHSLLDAADLVFIDPVGTGASMPIAGKDAAPFFSVGGDARAVAMLIDRWKQANGRAASPTIIVGESYGTQRALAMLNEAMKARQPLPDGVVLLALALGGDGSPATEAMVQLPTLAAVAWYHGAADRGGRTIAQQFEAARQFAETDYVTAMVQGSALPAADRAALAARIAPLVGLPADVIAKSDLAVDKQDFMLGLLAAKGLRTGQLDARATRAIAASNFHPPFDDPSMSLGSDTTATIERYLKDELGYAVPSPYRSLNLGINFKWNYEAARGGAYAGGSFAPYLTAAMAAKPSLRVFTAGGYFDLTTPVEAGIFALNQARVPVDRRTTHFYPTGHSIAEDETGLEELSADLHDFIGRIAR
jgi:carboxypeptidase C (cathepsin A)